MIWEVAKIVTKQFADPDLAQAYFVAVDENTAILEFDERNISYAGYLGTGRRILVSHDDLMYVACLYSAGRLRDQVHIPV